MIPISPDKVLEIPDPDGGKTVFKFRYLLDEYQADFMTLQAQLEEKTHSYIPLVKKEVAASTKGKRLKKGDVEAITLHAASNKFFGNVRKNPKEFLGFTNQWIDLFMCGWSGCSEKFPQDNKPSKYLGLFTKLELFTKLMENLDELCLMSKSEVGN
jgi:hypothetical protein